VGIDRLPLHLAAVATLATYARKTRGILVDAMTTVTRGHHPRTSPEDITPEELCHLLHHTQRTPRRSASAAAWSRSSR
jgi:hypothetical protein